MSIKSFIKSKQFLLHLGLIIFTFGFLVYGALLTLKVYTNHGELLSIPDFTGFTEQEASVVAKTFKLRYHINDSLFVPDVVPGSIVSQTPATGSRVKEGRMVYLIISAMAPEKVLLPMVVDVSFREAQGRLLNAGLRLGKVDYRPSEFINLVLESRLHGQLLPNDTMLIKGTAIDLVVGKGLSNEKTLVPDLFGFFYVDARETLYNISLNTGALIYDESVLNAKDTLNARIWKQNPAYSTSRYFELGVSVDLWFTVNEEKLVEPTVVEPENFDNHQENTEVEVLEF